MDCRLKKSIWYLLRNFSIDRIIEVRNKYEWEWKKSSVKRIIRNKGLDPLSF